MADKNSILTEELKRFSSALSALSVAYSSLATWLEAQNISEISGGGTPTAKRALQYLGGFTGTVLKAYSSALLDNPSAPPEIVTALVMAEASAKAAGSKRPASDITDPDMRSAKDSLAKSQAIERRKRAKNKR